MPPPGGGPFSASLHRSARSPFPEARDRCHHRAFVHLEQGELGAEVDVDDRRLQIVSLPPSTLSNNLCGGAPPPRVHTR